MDYLRASKRNVTQVLIPAAGQGSRLFPATKEQPKEMLPLFSARLDSLQLVPTLQLIFEQLFKFGFRKFCFVVGRDKRVIEDHFGINPKFLDTRRGGVTSSQNPILTFQRRIQESTIMWVNQPEPLGFGHAVLMGESVIAAKTFLVHAGDTLIYSDGGSHLQRMAEAHSRFGADVTLLLKEIPNPKHYGVAEAYHHDGLLQVSRVIEKPSRPRSNLAIMPVYIFEPRIFEALRNTRKGVGGELQLTDGIQKIVEWGGKVTGVILRKHELRLDIGNPGLYWEALSASHRNAMAQIE